MCSFLASRVFDDEIRNEDYFYYQLHSGEVFVDHITANDQCGFCLQLLLPNARKQALYAPYTGHIWRTENAGRNCWHCSKQAAWSIIFDFALLETFYHIAETDDVLDICNRKSFFQLPFSINFEMTIVSFQIVSLFFRLKKDAMPLKSSLCRATLICILYTSRRDSMSHVLPLPTLLAQSSCVNIQENTDSLLSLDIYLNLKLN